MDLPKKSISDSASRALNEGESLSDIDFFGRSIVCTVVLICSKYQDLSVL